MNSDGNHLKYEQQPFSRNATSFLHNGNMHLTWTAGDGEVVYKHFIKYY